MVKRPVLIFDFGNVVVKFDYARVGRSLGPPLGLSPEGFLQAARERGFAELLKRYESGGMTSQAFEEAFLSSMGLSIPHEEFVSVWNDIFWINEPLAKLVASLREREYTLVLGSNTNAMHAAFYRKEYAQALSPFDHLVLSHEVGHVKPSPEFYLACARAASAEPSECLFIDDLPENIEGALAAGLRGIVYRDDATLIDDLMREGVEVPGNSGSNDGSA